MFEGSEKPAKKNLRIVHIVSIPVSLPSLSACPSPSSSHTAVFASACTAKGARSVVSMTLARTTSGRVAPEAQQVTSGAVALLSVLAATTAVVAAAAAAAAAAGNHRKRRQAASRTALAKSVVGRGVRVLLAIDIGSSSVRCSAYTVGSPPVLVPGCAVQIKHAVVKAVDGTADAEEVIDLVDMAVDQCFR